MKGKYNTPVSFFDMEESRKQGTEALQAFQIPDTILQQQCLLYARLHNHVTCDMSDLDASMFDGFESTIFKAIKQVEGGNTDYCITEQFGDVLVYMDHAAQEYCVNQYFKTPDEYSKENAVVFDINNQVERGFFNRCKNIVIEAHNKRKVLTAAINMLSAKDAAEAARHARIVSHHDNTTSCVEFDATMTFERRKYLFTYHGAALGQTHNFYTLMGAQKSGKSHIFAVLLSTMLYGECCGFKYIGDPDPVILYFDTEQDITDAQEITHTANVLGGKPVRYKPENLKCFSLANTPREKVFDVITEQVVNYDPTIIFIDGYGGMVDDVNDVKCTSVVNDLRVLAQTKDCSIFGIVHTTPTAAVLKALGVFGSELQRWGAGTFLNEKQDGFFKMSAFELRKGGDVQPFYYRLLTSIVCDGEATPPFEYCELTDQLNRIGKQQNDVEILAIPSPFDEEQASARETLKALAEAEERRAKKRMRVENELRAKMCAIFEGDEARTMTRADITNKFADRFGLSDTPESNKRQAKRKIDDAATFDILSFDPMTGTYRYKAPKSPENEDGQNGQTRTNTDKNVR